MSFKFGYIHVNRQGNISDIIISHYKYNTRATPGRSQLSIHIKESLFKYLFIYLFIYIFIYLFMHSMFKKMARRIYKI